MAKATRDPVTRPLPRINECESLIDAMAALSPTEQQQPVYRQIGQRLSQLCYSIQEIDAALRGQLGTGEGGILTRLEMLENDYEKLDAKVDSMLKMLREYIRDENARHAKLAQDQAEREAGRRKTRAQETFSPSWWLTDVVKPIVIALLLYFFTVLLPKIYTLIP